ncbi:MAG: ABC transporter substrate-binding protein [Gammaproteobacteria bacterium]|nr:ABC transporter substrate-binding protein [Gammaproteobacteria bacterium]
MRVLTGYRTLIVALFLLSSYAAAAAVNDPQQLVRSTGEKVLAEVSARRAELEADPKLIYPLVETTVLPHFDFQRMSQSALGRFWRRATDEQKAGVTREFREMLIRTYATALLGYSGQTIEYLPFKSAPDADKVVVQTRVASGAAPPVPVDYRLVRNEQQWQVYDVVIDGVSLITNYRSQFTTVVRRSGIDGLITALAEKNRNPGGE